METCKRQDENIVNSSENGQFHCLFRSLRLCLSFQRGGGHQQIYYLAGGWRIPVCKFDHLNNMKIGKREDKKWEKCIKIPTISLFFQCHCQRYNHMMCHCWWHHYRWGHGRQCHHRQHHHAIIGSTTIGSALVGSATVGSAIAGGAIVGDARQHQCWGQHHRQH